MKRLRHGHAKRKNITDTYKTWLGMFARCNNKKEIKYYGMEISKDWSDFKKFLTDMGERPTGMSLDRIDNDKGYSKENCRWATKKEQANNRITNHLLTYNGETKTITEWSLKLNISKVTLRSRIISGWNVEKALSTPVDKRFSKK